MKNTLPTRMDKVLDDIGVGAIVKNVNTDKLAVVVDCGNRIMVCSYKTPSGDHEPTFNIKDYVLEIICKNEEWLVLTEGYDFDLSDT
jgi:hypothetical protein